MEAIGTAFLDSKQELGAVINTRYISARCRREAQLEQAQKLQAIGLLTGGITHDFNNLHITASINYSPTLLTDPTLPERLGNMMQTKQFDNSRLIFEMTETAVKQNTELPEVHTACRCFAKRLSGNK